jgi:hypothetical protein
MSNKVRSQSVVEIVLVTVLKAIIGYLAVYIFKPVFEKFMSFFRKGG